MKKWMKYTMIAMLSIALTFTMIPMTSDVYADIAEDPDSVPVSEAECESVPTDRYITPDMIPNSEPVQNDSAKSSAKSGTKSGEKSIKTIPTAVVVIGFKGMPYSKDYDWGNVLFGSMNSRSLKQYYTDMSYGQLTFVPVSETSKSGVGGNTNTYDKVNDGIIHVNVDRYHKDWHTNDISNKDNAEEMARSFVDAASKANDYVDVSGLDANNNERLDEEELALVFIVAGYDSGPDSSIKEQSSDLYFHSHKWSIYGAIDRYGMGSELALPEWGGKKLNPYVSIAENCETATGVVPGRMSSLAHELGHHLGLKDLYDTGSKTGPWKNYKVYRMSIMANGSWARDSSGKYCPVSFDPWSRIKLGWTEPSLIQLGSNGLASQDFDHPTIQNNILKVPKESIYPYEIGENKGEYYLIEVRRAEKWDEGISTNYINWKTSDKKGGLVFWHIDDKVLAEYGTTKKINTSDHRPGVMPLYLEDNYKSLISDGDTVHYTTPLFDKYNWDNHKDDSNQLGDEINLPSYNGSNMTAEPIDSWPKTRTHSNACIQITTYSGHYMQVIFWDRTHSHDFETIVTEPAGYGYEGTKYRYCTGCGAERWLSIPALTRREAIGGGASKEDAHNALTSYGKETDPPGSKFSKLKLKTVKQTRSSIKLSWLKAGAKKYVVYGCKCGKGNKFYRLRTTTATSGTFRKIAGTKLKAKKYYKFIIVALNSKDDVVSTSKMIHVATKGSKYKSNHTSVYVSKKIRSKAKKLKKGKKLALKAKAKKKSGYKVVKHVGLRYQSSNKKIVTVTSKGTIKGIKKGKAKVWVYAQNGVYRTINVTVK